MTELNPNERLRAISGQFGLEIETASKAMGLGIFKYHEDEGKDGFIFLSQGNALVPKEIAKKLTRYTKEKVLVDGGVGRKDCSRVAGNAVKDLEVSLNGFHIGTLGTNLKRTPKRIFREFGYDHHVINFIEDNESFIAFDLTAGYTMDAEQGNYVAFAVAGKGQKEVEETLKNLTGTKWEVR